MAAVFKWMTVVHHVSKNALVVTLHYMFSKNVILMKGTVLSIPQSKN